MNTADPCLDAETLAAWVDGGLRGDELRMVQSHVADCVRCQSLVGAMARTDAVIPSPEPQRATRRWLAWAVPLTAAAAALVVWTIVPRNTTTAPTAATEVGQTQAAPAQPEVITSPEVIPEPEAAVEKKAESPAVARPAESRDQRAESKSVVPSQAPQASQNVTISGEAPVVAPGAPPATRSAPARALSESITTNTPRVQDLCGPTAAVTQQPGVTTPLTAGSSPAARVCWVVGRLGVVLLTTDGSTWRGVMFPVITDLSSVTATDARVATVTTKDGRVFTTTDGGVTWKQQA